MYTYARLCDYSMTVAVVVVPAAERGGKASTLGKCLCRPRQTDVNELATIHNEGGREEEKTKKK